MGNGNSLGLLSRVGQALVAMVFCSGLTGCLVIGGSSRGGFFMWPGGFGLLLMLALLFFLNRRR